MSVLVNNLRPDNLFKFINIRASYRADDDKKALFFVQDIYTIGNSLDLKGDKKALSSLYPNLEALIGTPDQLKKHIAILVEYKTTKYYIKKADEYNILFPQLTEFIAWMDCHASTTSFKEIQEKFGQIFKKTPQEYFASLEPRIAQLIFWNNLLVNLFSTDDAFLVTLSCKYLAGLHIVQVIAENDKKTLEQYSSKIVSIYHAKPLVPKWIFNLLTSINLKADTGVGDRLVSKDKEDNQKRYNALTTAIKEIRNFVVSKEDTLKYQVEVLENKIDDITRFVSAKDFDRYAKEFEEIYKAYKKLAVPYDLKKEDITNFSETTQFVIEQLIGRVERISIQILIDKLLIEINETQSKIAQNRREYSVKIGSTIISRKDLCADMADKDPCAILPRQDFLSKGSFINNAVVGDLLITKQQLIKYDTGEVAHVENAMQGLEKERIFRRLNRTETTTTITHESTNESERETQTTERFSMEKETSNAIEQNFKIDAGVNVTANYGVAKVNSSLDASYGYSQQQSNSVATAFSKDVTDKAITRVKELVRETQTVTVINEVEETSTHKLTNDTGDNINGVYCWLDKFYLNKIENYGRRLMIEQTIPEPANFYIFRSMAKPATGNSMENPENPSEIVGPDGLALTGPTVLNETNYAFWISKYDVANADAPPQQYISVSKSWKNEYETRQSGDQYDSFASEIAIPADYEAISANVYAEHYNWGSNHNIHGSIGTSYFGQGMTTVPLNKIQNSVGIAMLSHGMNFRLNVVIKAERSEDAFNKWKNDLYNQIISAYNQKKSAYDEWINNKNAEAEFNFIPNGNNPEINRQIEKEELKKRFIELFSGQRFESFDAATNGIQNVSGYPEILFDEAIREGNLVKFFEHAFEWENITYIFYPYFWGRKSNWLAMKNLEDVSDPIFTKFLQAGYARVQVPVRPGFENYVLMFNLISSAIASLGCSWNFSPGIFGALGISNEFSPGVDDIVYQSVTQELIDASGWSLDNPNPDLAGHFVQKIPTNLAYIIPNNHVPGTPMPGLPDNSADPEISPYL